MKTKLLAGVGVVLLILAAGLPFSGPAWADEGYGHGKGDQRGYGGYGGHGWREGRGHAMGGRHASTGHLIRGLLMSEKEMGLTGEQVSKLKAIQLELDKTRIKLEADIMVAERDVQALVEDDKSDLAAIEAKMKESENLEVALRMAAIKARRDVMALLTPEQSARIKAVHEKMMMQMKERYGKGEGMGQGMMKGHGQSDLQKGEGKKGEAKTESKH
jgi:Spy/CpxP family protein refolding chaperone